MMNVSNVILTLFFGMFSFHFTMLASSNGKIGKTATNGNGCSCHSSSVSSAVGFSFQGVSSQIRVHHQV
jgi:hypothetical protein